MFVDTSAIISILSREDDADNLVLSIESTSIKVTSALVYLEATMRLSTKLAIEPLKVAEILNEFLEEARIGIVPIDGPMAKIAVEAFSAYGKGRGHPAQLNLGDCLSYACARSGGMPLLYKGSDFSKTDMA
jgi:ribonuclease VapC